MLVQYPPQGRERGNRGRGGDWVDLFEKENCGK